MYYYIYKITCTKGSFKDKFYFGQHHTENLDDDYKGTGALLKKYYKKYPNDYIKEIIAFYNTQEELNNAEYDIIHPYLNNPNCLNLRDGGNCGEYSEETKKKISESLKSLYKDHPEIIENMKNTKRLNKKPISEETKSKMSESHKKRWETLELSEETKNKLSKIRKGCHLTEETKNKISLSKKGKQPWNTGKHLSEETIEKIRISNTGKHHTEESKIKMSEKRRGELNPMYGKSIKDYMTEENIEKWRENISETLKGRKFSEEHKKKISEALKNYHNRKKKITIL